MRPATEDSDVSCAWAYKNMFAKVEPTRIYECEVLNHEPKRIRQEAKRGDQQRPKVQALVPPESREHQEHQFKSIVDRECTSDRDKDRGDIIVAREEGGRVVEVGEGYIEAHSCSIALLLSHMAECDRRVVSWMWDRGHWCRMSQK
jgi:hypothetical protein